MSENQRFYLNQEFQKVKTQYCEGPAPSPFEPKTSFPNVPKLRKDLENAAIIATKLWLESRKSFVEGSHIDALIDILLADTAFQFIVKENHGDPK